MFYYKFFHFEQIFTFSSLKFVFSIKMNQNRINMYIQPGFIYVKLSIYIYIYNAFYSICLLLELSLLTGDVFFVVYIHICLYNNSAVSFYNNGVFIRVLYKEVTLTCWFKLAFFYRTSILSVCGPFFEGRKNSQLFCVRRDIFRYKSLEYTCD